MTTLQVKAQLSLDELLKAVKQLEPVDLDRFTAQIIALRSHKEKHLSREETELFIKINQTIPAEIQEPYQALVAKRKSYTLTPEEHDRLLQLSNTIEKLEAERVAYLSQLATLRRTSLSALLETLDIQPPAYD